MKQLLPLCTGADSHVADLVRAQGAEDGSWQPILSKLYEFGAESFRTIVVGSLCLASLCHLCRSCQRDAC